MSKRKYRRKAKVVAEAPVRETNRWSALLQFIAEYGEACRADETKGGGDPAEIPLIEAELVVARTRIEMHITQMRREFES